MSSTRKSGGMLTCAHAVSARRRSSSETVRLRPVTGTEAVAGSPWMGRPPRPTAASSTGTEAMASASSAATRTASATSSSLATTPLRAPS